MKRITLILAMMLIGMISMAQNYLGKSLDVVKIQLDKSGVEYDEYVNNSGTYTVKVVKIDEVRVYVFDYGGKCSNYYIYFESGYKVYEYGKLFTSMGWKPVKGNLDAAESVKWEFTTITSTAVCFYQESENAYLIDVRLK